MTSPSALDFRGTINDEPSKWHKSLMAKIGNLNSARGASDTPSCRNGYLASTEAGEKVAKHDGQGRYSYEHKYLTALVPPLWHSEFIFHQLRNPVRNNTFILINHLSVLIFVKLLRFFFLSPHQSYVLHRSIEPHFNWLEKHPRLYVSIQDSLSCAILSVLMNRPRNNKIHLVSRAVDSHIGPCEGGVSFP